MAVEIFYNGTNVSDDYYGNKGKYFNDPRLRGDENGRKES